MQGQDNLQQGQDELKHEVKHRHEELSRRITELEKPQSSARTVTQAAELWTHVNPEIVPQPWFEPAEMGFPGLYYSAPVDLKEAAIQQHFFKNLFSQSDTGCCKVQSSTHPNLNIWKNGPRIFPSALLSSVPQKKRPPL